MNYYASADRMIKTMNRLSMREFATIRTMKFDELTAITAVKQVYRRLEKQVRRHLYEACFDFYIVILYECGITGPEANELAEKAINSEWLDWIMHEVDPVTLYRFDAETERKAERLVEAIVALKGPNATGMAGTTLNQEVDRALRNWSRQVGWFAIWAADEAARQAMQDAGVQKGQWQTADDERVCSECNALDGKVFELDAVPAKPHRGCRCILRPVRG